MPDALCIKSKVLTLNYFKNEIKFVKNIVYKLLPRNNLFHVPFPIIKRLDIEERVLGKFEIF